MTTRPLPPIATLINALALLVVPIGCSSVHGVDDAGTTDGAPVVPDGQVPDSPLSDAGATADLDGDGVAAGLDCNDAESAVGRTASRVCSTGCGLGTEQCTDGQWTICDAPGCACEAPGDTRVVTCGACGLESQRCSADMVWVAASACLDEGECSIGDLEYERLDMCGERARICDDECRWRDWTTTRAPGDCLPGAMERVAADCAPSSTRFRRCDAECTWGPPQGECIAFCTRPPRPSRTGADPVCIPAGPFVLGSSSTRDAFPERIVELSEYYVDRFPVTRSRFDACLAAGACAEPANREEYDALAPGQVVIGINGGGMAEFCEWDGGAHVTDFQWEKAARGPDPDRRTFPWGASPGTECVHHPGPTCPATPLTVADDVMTGSVSPYGVRFLGSIQEITSTPFLSGWEWLATATDPPPPASPTSEFTARGFHWIRASGEAWLTDDVVSARGGVSSRAVWSGFRCAY